ncbi:MAG: hypothetical protein ACREOJ_06950 [Gemmatimonadaceae bacterium]
MGCLRRIGCLVLLIVIVVIGWATRRQWLPLLQHKVAEVRAPAAPAGVVWEPISDSAAARASAAIEKLGTRAGPVFANLSAGELASYLYQQLARQLPPSAEHVEAAVIGDQLVVRASVQLTDFGGRNALGPLASVVGAREMVEFGGTLDVVHSALGEFRVRSITVRDLTLPSAMIPKLLRQAEHGARPAGVADDGLPLVIPSYLADARINNGKITLYKAVS